VGGGAPAAHKQTCLPDGCHDEPFAGDNQRQQQMGASAEAPKKRSETQGKRSEGKGTRARRRGSQRAQLGSRLNVATDLFAKNILFLFLFFYKRDHFLIWENKPFFWLFSFFSLKKREKN
jgi:hypothetical protein